MMMDLPENILWLIIFCRGLVRKSKGWIGRKSGIQDKDKLSSVEEKMWKSEK